MAPALMLVLVNRPLGARRGRKVPCELFQRHGATEVHGKLSMNSMSDWTTFALMGGVLVRKTTTTNLLVKWRVGARVGVAGGVAYTCGIAHASYSVVRATSTEVQEGHRGDWVAVPVAGDLSARRSVGGGNVACDQRGEGDEVLHPV